MAPEHPCPDREYQHGGGMCFGKGDLKMAIFAWHQESRKSAAAASGSDLDRRPDKVQRTDTFRSSPFRPSFAKDLAPISRSFTMLQFWTSADLFAIGSMPRLRSTAPCNLIPRSFSYILPSSSLNKQNSRRSPSPLHRPLALETPGRISTRLARSRQAEQRGQRLFFYSTKVSRGQDLKFSQWLSTLADDA